MKLDGRALIQFHCSLRKDRDSLRASLALPRGSLQRAIKLSLACLMVSFVHNHSSKLGNYAQKNQMGLRSSSFIARCGKTGIRTLEPRKGLTVFETAPIDHSGIFPKVVYFE